ncbi:MAG: hypothetical protein JWP38_2231 [Herbaspirillum sp.]|nr:hypothetical protein [Herbaspirillum sp.]
MSAPYIQQRFHPRLKIGYTAMMDQGKRNVPVHCRQGEIDGACGTYCCAILLTLYGRISNPAVLSERRTGVAARLWKAAQAVYFDGIHAKPLAKMLHSLDADLLIEVCDRSHSRILLFTEAQLSSGRLVILAWRTRNHAQQHWTLVIGIEGLQSGRRFMPQTFLCLDPGAPQPELCGYNARLEFSEKVPGYSSSFATYLSTDNGNALPVTLIGAVAVGETK